MEGLGLGREMGYGRYGKCERGGKRGRRGGEKGSMQWQWQCVRVRAEDEIQGHVRVWCGCGAQMANGAGVGDNGQVLQ